MSEAIGRLLRDIMPFDGVRTFADRPILDKKLGSALADAGVPRLCAPVVADGLGLGAVDAIAVIIECGRHLAPWPVTETLIAHALTSEQAQYRKSVDPNAGDDVPMIIALESDLSVTTTQTGRTITGTLPRVSWVAEARWLLAGAGHDGEPHSSDSAQVSELFLIDLHDPAVHIASAQSLDLTYPIGSVTLQAYMLPHAAVVMHPLHELKNFAALLAAAEALGAAEHCLQCTNAYLKEREQFKRPIGTFQALKHSMADDAVRIESMRVAILYAAWAMDAHSDDADMAVAIAKSYTADAARTVAENAIQLHGGIAYTWEYGLHLYLRRILRCGVQAGTARDHRETLAAALLDRPLGCHPAAAHQL